MNKKHLIIGSFITFVLMVLTRLTISYTQNTASPFTADTPTWNEHIITGVKGAQIFANSSSNEVLKLLPWISFIMSQSGITEIDNQTTHQFIAYKGEQFEAIPLEKLTLKKKKIKYEIEPFKKETASVRAIVLSHPIKYSTESPSSIIIPAQTKSTFKQALWPLQYTNDIPRIVSDDDNHEFKIIIIQYENPESTCKWYEDSRCIEATIYKNNERLDHMVVCLCEKIFANALCGLRINKNYTLELYNTNEKRSYNWTTDGLPKRYVGNQTHIDFSKEENLRSADFSNADLSYSIFDNQDLSNAKFDHACIKGTSFAGANLVGASFIGVTSK
ncbi:pentapeptide repeat-containing protein [Candidatus Babeliales bacterium]|nr:pentapeptide repeat-containing protein [Candidatus Babeliales bacterium]